MSLSTNSDRTYVNRQFRAKIRLGQDHAMDNVSIHGLGAALMDIGIGGCCLRISRSDLPFAIGPESSLPSIKLLHPELESTPIMGRIAWSREEPPYVLIGVQFLKMQAATQESIQGFVEASRALQETSH